MDTARSGSWASFAELCAGEELAEVLLEDDGDEFSDFEDKEGPLSRNLILIAGCDIMKIEKKGNNGDSKLLFYLLLLLLLYEVGTKFFFPLFFNQIPFVKSPTNIRPWHTSKVHEEVTVDGKVSQQFSMIIKTPILITTK